MSSWKWVALLVGIVGILLLLVNPVAEWLIVNKIQKNALLPYEATFKDVELRVWSGDVTIDSLAIDANAPRGFRFAVHAEKAELLGWNWLAYLLNNRVEVEQFKIVAPKLTWHRMAKTSPPDSTSSNSKNAIRLKSIAVQRIIVERGQARLYDSTGHSPMLAVDSFSTDIDDYQQRSRPGQDSFYLADGQIQVAELRWQFQHYDMQTKGVAVQWKDRALEINQFNLLPKYSKRNFSKKIGERKGRLDLSISGIEVQGAEFEQLLRKQIILQSIAVDQAELIVHEDQSVAKTSEQKSLPHSSLRQSPWGIHVDTTRITDSYVRYERYNPDRDTTGYIDFHDARLTVQNMTNRPSALRQDSVLQVEIAAQFMEAASLTSSFQFDLISSAYAYQGSMSAMNLQALNPISVPLAGRRVKSGQLHELQFDIEADHQVATGTVRLTYENLALTLLEKQGEKNVLSFLANTFVINQKNLPEGNFRIGSVDTKRDQTTTIFFHIWSALRNGLKEIVAPSLAEKES